jgi:hypothetical protein
MKKSSSTETVQHSGNCPPEISDDLYDYVTMTFEPLWFLLEKLENEGDRSYVLMDLIQRELFRRITEAVEAIKRDVGDIKISFNYAKRHKPELVLGAQLVKE